MVLYKSNMAKYKRDRPGRELKVSIDEMPQRPVYVLKSPKERVKYIKTVEAVCRKSMEYKELISFLKRNTDLRRCTVLKGLRTDNGKKYSIDIHHEPFTLFDIVETVLNRREAEGDAIDPLSIADEVMGLHFDGKVGLIHLSKTMHQLVHDDKIFIPLQFVYQKYDIFWRDYNKWINPLVKEKIEAKVELSMKTDAIVSDAIDPLFTYIHIDGFDFPQIPDEWKSVLHMEGSTDDTASNAVSVATVIEA